MRVGLFTLGCDKNTVDNEYLAGLLESRGCTVVAEPDLDRKLDAAVVTTCGFVGDAKAQSMECLVQLAALKREQGNPRRVFAAGCLAQRYAKELLEAIPELDGVVGVGQFESLANLILAAAPAPRNAVQRTPKVEICSPMPRKRLDKAPYAFLKIADGCNHRCTFCSIPQMKGKLCSVAPDILLAEARALVRRGVKELVVVAQDISVYGRDRGKEWRLPRLLESICDIPGDFWVRCLYCYPAGVTNELLRVMAEQPKIVPYLDIPLQHFDPEILRRMKRPSSTLDPARLVDRIRAAVPGIALRTTLIVGFPGETAAAHRRMLAGIEALRFERLGAFMYSREEDTVAGAMPGQVRESTKYNRWNAVMELQAEISAEHCGARVGQQARVLIEGYDEEQQRYLGRSAAEAPEVDGLVFVESPTPLKPGLFEEVTITDADVYDVYATLRNS